MKTNLKRACTIVLSALTTLCLAGGYVMADAAGIVPGSISGISRIYREGSIAALNPQRSVRKVGKQTVASVAHKDINASQAQELIDNFMSSLPQGVKAGVLITTTAGKEVASANASDALTPASTLKTLVGYAASVTFPSQETLKTTVKMEKSSSDSTSAALTLVGGGDILLGSGANDAQHVNGRAGLATLADQTVQALQSRGITQVSLQYDDSLFNHDSLPEIENASSPVNQGYTNLMETSSMAVDEARNWYGQPPANPDGEGPWYPQRYANPAASTAEIFAQALTNRGIKLTNENIPQVSASESAFDIAQVESAPLGQIIQLMLTNSDNSLAQLLGRLLALCTGHDNTHAGASDAVVSVLKQHGISTDGLVMADTSGLGDGSAITPQLLAQVQSAYLNTAGLTWNAAVGMPISHYNGTLLNRAFNAETNGLVRAKTGSLEGVRSLAGNVVRTNGGALIFVVIVNGESAIQALPAMNTFVDGLVTL